MSCESFGGFVAETDAPKSRDLEIISRNEVFLVQLSTSKGRVKNLERNQAGNKEATVMHRGPSVQVCNEPVMKRVMRMAARSSRSDAKCSCKIENNDSCFSYAKNIRVSCIEEPNSHIDPGKPPA